MVVGSKLARQAPKPTSPSGSPARDTDSNITGLEIGVDTGTGTGIDIGTGIGTGLGIGMFRPQPTPFSAYGHGLHIANAGIPDYTFAATPLLGQFGGVGGGHVGGTTGNGDGGLVGGMGMGLGRGGPSTVRAAPTTPSNFHSSPPAGMQGLGSSAASAASAAAPANASDNSAGYSSGSATTNIHPCLFNIPMAVSMPHHSTHQHLQTQSQQQQQHRHHQQNQTQQQQHQRQRQQHTHQHQLQLPHQQPIPQHPHLSDRIAHHYKMDQQPDLDPSEIAQQEAAARDFEPQLEGPLVGEKLASHAITEEYAGADPTYVAKTMALPQTYSHYRPIQGDGNCGWRAIAFAYFETLIQCGNIDLVRREVQRMTDLNKYIEEVGGQEPSILDLMVEETFLLFNDIIVTMSEGNDPLPNLVTKFNDPQISQCLVYHLRLLACARLKGSRTDYAAYLGSSVEDYLETTVMPVNREIDHICINLVCDILLVPANMVLDIAYLDRSEGTEVNVHRFPGAANGQDPSTLGPIIHLLYRPGHYDILYRETQVPPPPPVPVNIQVHRVSSFTPHNHDFEHPVAALQDTPYTMNLSPLSMIPGLSSSSLSSFGPPSTTPPPMTDTYATSPGSSWVPSRLGSDVLSIPLHGQPSPPQQQATVRFSKWNFPHLAEVAAENNSIYEPAFTTNTFKNSHYNTAHYNNMNFQPEMYKPDAEEEALSSGNGKTGGRKRSTEHCPGIKKEK